MMTVMTVDMIVMTVEYYGDRRYYRGGNYRHDNGFTVVGTNIVNIYQSKKHPSGAFYGKPYRNKTIYISFFISYYFDITFSGISHAITSRY